MTLPPKEAKVFLELVGQALPVGVVDQHDAGGLIANLPGETRQHDALGGVGYRSAEEEIVILQDCDGGRGGCRAYQQALLGDGD